MKIPEIEKSAWGVYMKASLDINFQNKVTILEYYDILDFLISIGGIRSSLQPLFNYLIFPFLVLKYLFKLSKVIQQMKIRAYRREIQRLINSYYANLEQSDAFLVHINNRDNMDARLFYEILKEIIGNGKYKYYKSF